MIKIYTVSDKRPDFIELQFNGFKNFLQDDDYEFIVCNNGSTPALKSAIENICLELNIKTLYVEGEYTNGAIATQVPLIYCLKNYISKDDKNNISVIIDSDIFLFAPNSFEQLLNGGDIAGIYQQRQKQYKRFFKINHYYIWNALIIFNNKAVNFNEFDLSMIQNFTDVGGNTNAYIKKFKPNLIWLNHTADIEDAEKSVFDESLIPSYKTNFGMQIIENSFIHYYRGSNWDDSANEYHKFKTEFLHSFLNLSAIKYPLQKNALELFTNNCAHTKKHFNGQRNFNKLNFKISKNNITPKWIM